MNVKPDYLINNTHQIMNDYPVLNWVTLEDSFKDYRPAIGPDGKSVVFERTSYASQLRPLATKLFIVHNLDNAIPQLFLNDCDSFQQTRPAWTDDTIALNLQYDGKSTVWTVDATGNNLNQIKNTNHCIYPQWAIHSTFKGFVVMNNKLSHPQSTLLNANGTIITPNLNGKDTNGNTVLGGMPAVFPNKSKLIAFAGQSLHQGNTNYNQEKNYIFLNAENGKDFLSMPMKPLANLNHFDKQFQGRAPAISPDGNYIAFESNRDGHYAIYLFNLSKPENPPIRLTDPTVKLNAQHPKFFPDGSRLIFSAVYPGHIYSSIAWIDISEYL
ncbi:PD40 domain-containing protein [Flavobacterium hydatis]|uniref:Uncharacterized protein n=1 Tax=Flavobacterium hydatis TaxID=991 RepID=A0A086ANY8_FLAHY|nr:PD40 domain-containing protein [Flavobacterium hydatis]KFF18402.1 hypothetical protein IW20_05765 [Flavobacterium hydatis]OXA96850.1 hypothetical protein B0A62_06250 [Flavobacterium hydatis]